MKAPSGQRVPEGTAAQSIWKPSERRVWTVGFSANQLELRTDLFLHWGKLVQDPVVQILGSLDRLVGC